MPRTTSRPGPWGQQYPTVPAAWRRAWDRVIPFFEFPQAIRKVIYTTNAIESVNAQLLKVMKTRGHFPTDEAATKLIWLGLRNITETGARALTTGKTQSTSLLSCMGIASSGPPGDFMVRQVTGLAGPNTKKSDTRAQSGIDTPN